LDRSVRHTKGAMGTITKIGVGVLINERPIPVGTKIEKPADGSAPPTSIAYTPEELDRLNQLVKGAVGFNETRGDVVTVVATKFEPQFDPSIIPWYRDENYQVMVNAGVVGAIFLLVLLLVVRPMVRRLTTPDVRPADLAAVAAEAANAEAKMAIEVATAEAAAAKLSAQQAREAHEAEIARIAEEAMLAAQEAARLSEEARIAAAAKAEADALAALNPAAGEASAEIEIQEGESLDEVKARMAAMKPKKQSISADLLNTANSYDDKVALIRMIVSEDSTRVAGVLKSLIRQ
ncbi:MAG: flagellar M-ring protein FliF C-terminal domain-containing protein, partial [Betaproteobacteria bacterium]